MDVTKSIHLGQILGKAYQVAATDLNNSAGATFDIDSTTYKVTTIYANDLATDMNPARITDQVSIGLICQAPWAAPRFSDCGFRVNLRREV
jgi:hypothetical protein